MFSTESLLDAAGHRRSPATMPGYHQGRPPKNKGQRFPADPPPVEEIIAVMRATSNNADGARLRALIVVLWRAGLRISEALDLAETDLDRARGALTVRKGKGGRRREVGMDRWAWVARSASVVGLSVETCVRAGAVGLPSSASSRRSLGCGLIPISGETS
jgi:integrase